MINNKDIDLTENEDFRKENPINRKKKQKSLPWKKLEESRDLPDQLYHFKFSFSPNNINITSSTDTVNNSISNLYFIAEDNPNQYLYNTTNYYYNFSSITTSIISNVNFYETIKDIFGYKKKVNIINDNSDILGLFSRSKYKELLNEYRYKGTELPYEFNKIKENYFIPEEFLYSNYSSENKRIIPWKSGKNIVRVGDRTSERGIVII